MKISSSHVKAFVDSGAQMTIMSSECARNCGLTDLIDVRFSGIAQASFRKSFQELIDRKAGFPIIHVFIWKSFWNHHKGVGTQKILGRIHTAYVQIGNDCLSSTFSVIENQPMGVIIGNATYRN